MIQEDIRITERGDEVGKWTMKGGEKIAIADMGDQHLLNAHRMMCRRLIELININRRKQYADDDEPAAIGIAYYDKKACRAMDKERELKTEIALRGLTPLVETPSDDWLEELENEMAIPVSYACNPTDIESGPFEGGV